MKRRAIKNDLFAGDKRREKLDALGDPLVFLERHVDFAALAAEVDRVAPRPTSENGGGRPPYPTETMVRILILKRLHNLSDEQIEYQLLDRMSYQRFCGLTHSASIPDRNTVWVFENRIGVDGATALSEAVQKQVVRHGYMARCGQLIDATLVPAPKQHFSKDDKEILAQDAVPADWSQAKRRQKDLDASWTKKHGKSHHGYKLSINADKRYKLIRKIEMSDATPHDSQHFDAVLDPANTSRAVYADKGYASAEREQALREAGYRDRIQRKGAREATGLHEFDALCESLGIEHRLTKPKSPQTNGMAERFNGRLEQVLRSHHFNSAEDLEQTLHRFVWLYNQHLPQKALNHETPIQALKRWQTSHPHLFFKPVRNRPGRDNYRLQRSSAMFPYEASADSGILGRAPR